MIGIAGLQGSGKTTLARALARTFGWDYISESATALRYIPELFENMHRLAFEAQIGFFCNKAIAIQEKLAAGVALVVDRTLYEDWHVFARYFRNIETIDDRGFSTYVTLAEYFTSVVPAPALTLLCECPVEIAKMRIDARKREAQQHYPPNHMEDIAELYEDWLEGYNAGPLAEVDSLVNDFRDANVVGAIADEVSLLLTKGNSAQQLDLFSTQTAPKPTGNLVNLVRGLEHMIPRGDWDYRATAQTLKLPDAPFAYLAAPFTEFAKDDTMNSVEGADELFPASKLHGTIPTGAYRRALLGIERRLAAYDLDTLIPHRDVNFWGRRTIVATDVFAYCRLAVQRAHLVVAILGHSPGAHFEVGLAQGIGKPLIAIQCSEIPTSYLAAGMVFTPRRTLVLRCDRLRDIPSVLSRAEAAQFLRTALPL
jgi:deoxyadenosine/deoxycytidine kinase